eukprot:TRINITY_DN31924_c0_g1_i1.p1 TRINITY_DN31924_c0_g1~~TRINITY_DN31924_c0_g1_i1.p1  ORF type:complete len:370 (-),score=63.57 TRINITY_DN31924_c0_g1_i1:112-1221(-)
MCLLLMWLILAVEFLHPVAQEVFQEGNECAVAFGSVFDAMLLLFQTLVAGDSWGRCSIDIIKAAPLTALIFAGSLIMIQIGITNLILAVVVEKAQEAHEQDVERRLREIASSKRQAERRLSEMCGHIDNNHDGTIGLPELLAFYDSSEELQDVLSTLDVRKEELTSLFHLMDSDNSGDLSYDELVNCISRADSNDLKRQIMMVKLQVQDVWERIRHSLQGLIESMSERIDVLVEHVDGKSIPATGPSRAQTDEFLPTSKCFLPDAIDQEMDRLRSRVNEDLARLSAEIQQQLGAKVHHSKSWQENPEDHDADKSKVTTPTGSSALLGHEKQPDRLSGGVDALAAGRTVWKTERGVEPGTDPASACYSRV